MILECFISDLEMLWAGGTPEGNWITSSIRRHLAYIVRRSAPQSVLIELGMRYNGTNSGGRACPSCSNEGRIRKRMPARLSQCVPNPSPLSIYRSLPLWIYLFRAFASDTLLMNAAVYTENKKNTTRLADTMRYE